jgi:16S rRNA (cytidine1402-2'-O)-methyltransferase
MPGILYVVATPIGNLEDVTLRALRVLREVAVIAAEDTRRTAHLLQHYSISTRTTSLHEHNEHRRVPGLIAQLEQGESIALVSDAGTPLVSDPGRQLVAAAHAAGIRVEPIPGPSAVMAAVSVSGLAEEGFVFAGFPPAKATPRARWLAELASEVRAIVFYEAPHRIRATLTAVRGTFPDRTIFVGRELTKRHEVSGVCLISDLKPEAFPELGEYVLVLSPKPFGAGAAVADTNVLAIFGDVTKNSKVGRREAAKLTAARLGISANAVYRLVTKTKNYPE